MLNGDNEYTASITNKPACQVLVFSREKELEEGAYIEGGYVCVRLDGRKHIICAVNEIPLPGDHNVENVLAASAAAVAFGISDEAVKKARTIVALPGTSEHQLGLALDIVAEYDADNTPTWNWLRDNCWRYGFILRYPADKEEITGISYEPWHFRYVGVPAAREIMEAGLCLEEYRGG